MSGLQLTSTQYSVVLLVFFVSVDQANEDTGSIYSGLICHLRNPK